MRTPIPPRARTHRAARLILAAAASVALCSVASVGSVAGVGLTSGVRSGVNVPLATLQAAGTAGGQNAFGQHLFASQTFVTEVPIDASRQTPADGGYDTVAVPAYPSAGDPEVVPVTRGGKPDGTSVRTHDVSYDDADGTVEIHVNDASLVEVLRMLSLQSQHNIIASKDVRGTVTANLYRVTVREALDAILHANGYGYREKGNFIYVYTAQELRDREAAERQRETRVFRLNYTNAASALNLIKPVLSDAGEVALTAPALSGLTSGVGDTGGNSSAAEDLLVVTDFAENLDRAAELLRDVDRRPQQILVEATILRASLSEDNQLGIDFNVIGGVNFGNISTSNGQVVGAGLATAAPDVTSVGTGSNFSGPINGGLKVGFVGGDMSVFLSALEGITDTTILANPKVLALNKQRGEVFVGREDGYITTTVSETTATQTVEFLKIGTRLIFRPYIAEDGYVRMEVHPEDSDGGISAANLPFKVTTEVTTNIMVRDGHTIVIGGLFRESSGTTRAQVPFLGNLPIAGPLFRNQRDRTTREEVIILLTPHIVKDDVAYSQISEEQLRQADRLRVGVRQGMMPWGRERLAEGNYERAMAELDKENPNTRRAIWHLDAATNLNPKFTEAQTLRRELVGREVAGSDNSTIRSFVRQSILTQQSTPVRTIPRETRIGPAAGTARPSDASDVLQPATPANTEPVPTTPARGPGVPPDARPAEPAPSLEVGPPTRHASVID